MQQQKPSTHVLWLQRWEHGKFAGWYQVGKGRIDIDAGGNASAENYQMLTTIGGWNGYTRLLPIGITPKDPEPQPKRPARSDGEEGF